MAGFINNTAGGLTQDLLWSNPNPTSSYTSGSATISAANYELFLIKFKYTSTESRYYSQIAFKGSGLIQSTTIYNGVCYADERTFTITDTTITWDKNIAYSYDDDSSNDSKYNIPIALYGLK